MLLVWRNRLGLLLWLIALVVCNNYVNCHCKDFVYTIHLLATALHIASSHHLSDSSSLVLGDWREALGFEEVNTGALVSEIRLETNKDEWGVRAEMLNLRVPLVCICQYESLLTD